MFVIYIIHMYTFILIVNFILQAAGNAVKRATDNLVKAAQQAIQNDEERSLVLSKRMVGGIAQEINAR